MAIQRCANRLAVAQEWLMRWSGWPAEEPGRAAEPRTATVMFGSKPHPGWTPAWASFFSGMSRIRDRAASMVTMAPARTSFS